MTGHNFEGTPIEVDDVATNEAGVAVRLNKKARKKNSFEIQKNIFVIALLALPVLYWLVFWFYVNIQSIALAFMDMRTEKFTLGNFVQVWEELTTGTGVSLGVSVRNTALYFLETVFLILPSCFVVAFFLYKRIMAYKFFRIMFYLPAVIPGIVLVGAFQDFFVYSTSPLALIVEKMGMDFPDTGLMNGTGNLVPTLIILVYCYWVGFTSNVLLFVGGMARIPIEVLESAKLEGVGPLREMVSIIFPLIWPTISTQIILACTSLFSASGPILLFSQGNYGTSTISYWIFSQVYGTGVIGGSGYYNLVSCAGLCFTVVGVPIIMLIRRFLNKIEAIEY